MYAMGTLLSAPHRFAALIGLSYSSPRSASDTHTPSPTTT